MDVGGDPWVITKKLDVFKWNGISEEWEDMNIKDAHDIAADPTGHVYVLIGKNLVNDGSGYMISRWKGENVW